MTHLAVVRSALPWRGRVDAALARVAVWSARRRQRSALSELDERGLRDIGVGRIEAEREARKPFWRG